MKLKLVWKLALDLMMAIVFALMFNKNVLSGLVFHEIAGFILCLAFLFHFIINFNWMKGVTKLLFSPTKKPKTKSVIGYILNCLLLIGAVLILLSGLAMAKHFLPGFLVVPFNNSKSLHFFVSSLTLIIAGIHLGLHWNMIKSFIKNKLNIRFSGNVKKLLSTVFAIIIFIIGGYLFISSNMPNWISTPIVTIFSDEVDMMQGHEKGEHPKKEAGSEIPAIEISAAFTTLGKYIMIFAFFATVTYYIEMVTILNREKIRNKSLHLKE